MNQTGFHVSRSRSRVIFFRGFIAVSYKWCCCIAKELKNVHKTCIWIGFLYFYNFEKKNVFILEAWKQRVENIIFQLFCGGKVGKEEIPELRGILRLRAQNFRDDFVCHATNRLCWTFRLLNWKQTLKNKKSFVDLEKAPLDAGWVAAVHSSHLMDHCSRYDQAATVELFALWPNTFL